MQVNSIDSMNRQLLINNIVGTAKAAVAYGLPIVHSTANVKSGANKPPIAPLRTGNLVTHGDKVTTCAVGDQVTTCAVEGGKVLAIEIKGELLANGQDSDAILVDGSGTTPLTNVRAQAKTGKVLHEADGMITDRTGFTIA